MGALSSKFFITQGYYWDMVAGFPTKAGGRAAVIPYPKGLLDLPHVCPKCKSRSGLHWDDMKEGLFEARRKFQAHAEAIIVQRLMNGEPDPYCGFIERSKSANKDKDTKKPSSKSFSPDSSANLLSFIKRNEVSPQTKVDLFEGAKHVDNTWEDYMGFEVDTNELVICDCSPMECRRYQKTLRDEETEMSKSKLESKLESKTDYIDVENKIRKR